MTDLCNADFRVTVLLADWHVYINDKLWRDWEKIGACAEYFTEAYRSLGVPEEVRYLYASELVADCEYWQSIIQASKASSVARIKRAMSIMGRQEEEGELDASKLIYPAMQVTDIHVLDLDLALGGLDQRRARMLYRDIAPTLGWKQVVALHTPMLSSLQGGGRMGSWDLKMSTSKPETCIFIHDSPQEIEAKIAKAYCPAQVVEGNPILEFCEHLLFPRFGSVKVERESRHGGDALFEAYGSLERAYKRQELHPQDLKAAVSRLLADLLADSRRYFKRQPKGLDRMREILGASSQG